MHYASIFYIFTGYYGERCQLNCPPGFYGLQCKQKCGCIHGEACNEVTGECYCSAGYHGKKCEQSR